MKNYITVTGTKYRYGTEWMKEGIILTLVKEPENEYDKEAIRVEAEGLGTIGYVANSIRTVMGNTMSAGRLYDRIGNTARVKVKYIMPEYLICGVKEKDVVYTPPMERGIEEDR